MSFRTYFLGLDAASRAAVAERARSTVGYLTQVAYGNKQIELGLADVLVAVTEGRLTLGDMPLTERAKVQDKIRKTFVMAVPAVGTKPEPTGAVHAG